jgi:prepilin-type N-terminal cleavage/methylation domain-containing protein
MIFRKLLKSFGKDQRGITLIEMLVSVAIAGIISLGATIANGQVLNQTSRNNDYTTASRQTLNALYWIGRDTQMAQTINGTSGFPATSDLTLTWTDWDNTDYEVVYAVSDGQLTRSYTAGGADPRVSFIADYINSEADKTYCTTDNGTLTLTITASVGEGDRIIDVTKKRVITSRPNL